MVSNVASHFFSQGEPHNGARRLKYWECDMLRDERWFDSTPWHKRKSVRDRPSNNRVGEAGKLH